MIGTPDEEARCWFQKALSQRDLTNAKPVLIMTKLHRSIDDRTECCETCKWWKRFDVPHTGQCRRFPPGKNNGDGPSSTGVDWHGSRWAHTGPRDWCGEWKMSADAASAIEGRPV